MKKSKLIILLLLNLVINLFLFSKIKIFLYRLFLRYKIDYSVSLGFFSILVCEKLEIGKGSKVGMLACVYNCLECTIKNNSKIYRKVWITGLANFSMGDNCFIGVGTTIVSRHSDRKYLNIEGGGQLIMGNNVHITIDHYFDTAASIEIKDNVTFGGKGSKVYTHSFDCYGNFSYGNILINETVYIGASVILLPGITVASEINIGAGAVVPKSLSAKGSYGGNPVRQISADPKSKVTIIKK